jgi:large subunit ribosomal protein L31
MADNKKKDNKRNEKKTHSGLKVADYKYSRDIPYFKVTITCACGAEFESGSVQESIRVDICAKCHPFFTGESRIVDAEGRVDKFRKRYALASSK